MVLSFLGKASIIRGHSMRTGTITLIVAAGLMLLASMVWFLLSGGVNEAPPGASARGGIRNGDHRIKTGTPRRAGENGESSTYATDGEEPESASDREAVAPQGSCIFGRVVDRETREPVTVYNLTLARWADHGTDPWKVCVRRIVKHEEGRFHIPLDEFPEIRGVKARCWVRSPVHLPHREDVEIPKEGNLESLCFELDPGAGMTGRVVDDATNDPVAGALVVRYVSMSQYPYYDLFLGSPSSIPHALSNEEGRFRLTGQSVGSHPFPWDEAGWRLIAFHPDYAQGLEIKAHGQDAEALFRLKKGPRFHGRVNDDEGNPASGIMVSVIDEEIPVPRAVLTGPDGTYLTDPVAPGKVILRAEPTPDRDGGGMLFTEETKRLVMGDEDQEIHFGPDSDHVTWKGRVLDRFGEPLSRCGLKLEPMGLELRERIELPVIRNSITDGKGRFEIGKLDLKTYIVKLEPTSWAHEIDWGEIRFDRSGLDERDVVIRGGEIRGSAVDATTGEPLVGMQGHVSLYIRSPRHRHFSCPFDAEARFRLTGIPEGAHNLHAMIMGYTSAHREKVEVKKDQIVEDVVIRLHGKGTLAFTFSGFSLEEKLSYALCLQQEQFMEFTLGRYVIDGPDDLEGSHELNTDTYKVTFDFGERGSVVRNVTLEPGKTARLVIRRSEIARDENQVTLEGLLIDPAGEPWSGVTMKFHAANVPDLDPDHRYIDCVTDGDGRFRSQRFRPGLWRVRCEVGPYQDHFFPPMEITEDSGSPFEIRFVLARGRITGILAEAGTGKILEKSGIPRIMLFLRDEGTEIPVNQIRGLMGSEFSFEGIPEGHYRLTVRASGWREYRSEALLVTGNQSIDLGKIPLQPAGRLEVRLVDPEGAPVKARRARWLGEWRHQWEEMAPGTYLFANLPVGACSLTLEADGFENAVIEVVATAGFTTERTVVMKPK